jgi:acyl carrier protein
MSRAVLTSVASDIRNFVVDRFMFGQGGDQLSDDDSFLQRGVIDSMSVLELIAFIEERWGLKVQDQDLVPDNLDSVNRVASFILRKQQ